MTLTNELAREIHGLWSTGRRLRIGRRRCAGAHEGRRERADGQRESAGPHAAGPAEHPCGLVLWGPIGEPERQPLELSDRLTELLARLGVRDRRIERALRDPYREGPDRDPPAIEDSQEGLEAAPLLAKHVRGRDPGGIE